jgi:hypothetical protein
MSQLVLPHTIDSGTEIVAVEHQANYTAIRDLINGQLEGGSGAAGNLKANTIGVREVAKAEAADFFGGQWVLQHGVLGIGDGKVTAGAGLVLNYAAGFAAIQDALGTLVIAGSHAPAQWAGSTVTIAANASGNPRIDQVIVTLTGWRAGTVSVLQGTPTAGATLANRNGAAALPSNTIRLVDVLMPNGFGGPFVSGTHLRDRRAWARGAYGFQSRTAGDVTNATSTHAAVALIDLHLELTGAPVEVQTLALGKNDTIGGEILTDLYYDGAPFTGAASALGGFRAGTANQFGQVGFILPFVPSAGRHSFGIAFRTNATGTATLFASATSPAQLVVREVLRGNGWNND